MFRKVLIANRGEIAVRIAQTLQQIGIRTVCVYSEADRRSLHVLSADDAYPLEGNTSAETYLRGDKILDIALRHGVDAIHPGYGFLSESAGFARACQDAGITFIGPTPEALRAVGDKTTAKRIAADAGVPVVPGWFGAEDGEALTPAQAAGRLGYPVLIKAAAGGGGKGMRLIQKEPELRPAFEAAQREAGSAFGDSRVFLEKYMAQPRHVEIQIFGDHHGNIVHLFERECSIQRRHQKIVEESPSPALTPELRRNMGEAAIRVAKAVGYTNAGTVEFMLDENGSFYFLEVNARLQVEHPVTEAVTGYDVVAAQVLVAAGEPLPFRQADLRQKGHAIECRIYAEDADRGFVPSTGVIEHYDPPSGLHVRVDSGVRAGSDVSIYYDPMLAKLIVWGQTRPQAIRRMSWALRHFAVLGVTTNIEFLQHLMEHPDFQRGRLNTHFLEEHRILAKQAGPTPPEAAIIAALAASSESAAHRRGHEGGAKLETPNPWNTAGAWRLV